MEKSPLAELIKELIGDIRGRAGLGDAWESIDKDVIENEIKPTWEEIIKRRWPSEHED